MKKTYLPLFYLLLLLACRKEEEARSFPEVTTSPDPVVTEEGVVISAEINQYNGSKIADHGVIYLQGSATAVSEEDYNRISLGELQGKNWFSVTIDRNLKKGEPCVAKAFVKTDRYTVYGNPVTFTSMGSKSPQLKDFSPKIAYVGDTIKLSGDYFASRRSDNQIWFGSVKTEPLLAGDTVLKVVVPPLTDVTSCILKVEVGGKTAAANDEFSLGLTEVFKYIPEKILPGKSVKISGKGLLQVNQLIIDENEQRITGRTDTTLIFTVYEYTDKGEKTVKINQTNRIIIPEKKFEVIFPEITSVTPSVAWIDTVLKVRGTNLDQLSSFYLGYSNLNEISRTDTLVKLKVLSVFDDAPVKGRFRYHEITAAEHIKFSPPVINEVSESVITYGDKILLKGDRFFNGLTSSLGTFEYISKNEATLALGWDQKPGSYPLKLSFNSDYLTSVMLTIPQAEVSGVSPYEVERESEIIINGKYFPHNASSWWAGCTVDNKRIEITEYDEQLIRAKILYYNEYREYPDLVLEFGPQRIVIPQAFHVTEKWQRVPDLSAASGSVFIASEGESYSYSRKWDGTGIIRRFDRTLEQWTYLDNVAGAQFTSFIGGFGLGADLYIAGRDQEQTSVMLYKYGISDGSWERLADFPGREWFTFGFIIDGKMYLGTVSGFYQFDPAGNTWIRRASLPTSKTEIPYRPLSFSGGGKGFTAFCTGSSFDIGMNEFWEYSASSNTWKNLGSLPVSVYQGGTATEYEGKVYLSGISGQHDKFGEFDPATYQFKEMLLPPWPISAGTSYSFIAGSYLYYLIYDSSPPAMCKIPVNDLPEIYK